MKFTKRAKRSQFVMQCSVVLLLAAFALVSCTSTETNTSAPKTTADRMSKATNPCAAKANPCNPCAAKYNPCNPCAAKHAAANPCNPCAAKYNPCNPCAAKYNPCNPCAAKHAAANPCNPCAAKYNPCNPCAAKHAAVNPCNPCAAKYNPCNPCAAKNPCNPCNPCGGGGKVDPQLVTRPAGTWLAAGSHAELVKEGKRLWNDRALGTNGLACGVCHLNNGNFNPTFVKPYAHWVQMPHQMAGLNQVALDEMVQFCILQPMAGKPLPWDSRELSALTAYSHEVQKDFIKAAMANPCLLKQAATNPCNPCAAKYNPCNPCAAKYNPCAAKYNPCAAKYNPCAAKYNPCNPCAAKYNPCNPCAAKRH